MFGWEFPPVVSGGLGVACHAIVQGLLDEGVDIALVLPFSCENRSAQDRRLQYIHALDQGEGRGKLHIELIEGVLQPYSTPDLYDRYKKKTGMFLYGDNLWSEVQRYAHQAAAIANTVPHDCIHAHDWLTILAGIEAKKISGKPLIFHVHALEEDRNWQYANSAIQAIEELGLQTADVIIAVSEYTKTRIIQTHHISPEKIAVVYNGHAGDASKSPALPLQKNERFMVLFLGRITEQKGPYYFIKAAEKILALRKDIGFIMAGDGDQLPFIIDTCARLGISSHVSFTGFLDRNDVNKLYQLSDVYVMPSVSEPFGLVCLEAIAHGVPVIISKQSGVSEVLTHALTVDYWDVDQLAEKIIALIDYPALKKAMLPHARRELSELTWTKAAQKIISLYNKISIKQFVT